MKLNLNRPLCFFDLETTGINITKDRIVEIGILKIFPDGKNLFFAVKNIGHNNVNCDLY